MAPPGRLVRRKPLVEKIKAYLNPWDNLLWLSEEIETRDWNTKSFATPLGLSFSFVFLIARANSGSSSRSKGEDDVFGDSGNSTGWASWFVGSPRERLGSIWLIWSTGCIFSSCINVDIMSQCILHILSQKALSTIRKLCRGPTKYSVSTPCEGRFISSCLITIAIPYSYP